MVREPKTRDKSRRYYTKQICNFHTEKYAESFAKIVSKPLTKTEKQHAKG